MKKVVLVFMLAVFVPSVVLAILAVRSLRDQQFVIERQQSLLYQAVADSVAKEAESFLADQQGEFTRQIETMLAEQEPAQLAKIFDDRIRTNWPLAEVGFIITPQGTLLCPGRAEAESFCLGNRAFLGSGETAEVYWSPRNNFANVQVPVEKAYQSSSLSVGNKSGYEINSTGSIACAVTPDTQQAIKNVKAPQMRSIVPQQQLWGDASAVKAVADAKFNTSKIAPSEAEFGQLVQESNEGMVARFLNNKLNLLVWYRPAVKADYIFGAQLSISELKKKMKWLFRDLDLELREQILVAILDDKAKPAAVCHTDKVPNWKRPFVATEIGEALPHWEVAVYLNNPATLKQSIKKATWFLGILITILVLEIALGSVQIFRDLKKQETLARQKTDFVSNVSHELKTPLTSIRMFSEMLAEGRVADAAKQRSYLNIITSEAARLTRLINNVLDFSRMERGEKKYNFQTMDLGEVVRETVETYRPHLETNGFRLELKFPQNGLSMFGDRDAVAQVIVNLLSNAEKYSEGKKEILVDVERVNANAEIKVLDRGTGVPRGCEEKIFEQFFRAHDSLSSGIQGSGLGLTLARQIARAHGGDVLYQPREGGGSCFTLRVPMDS